MANFAWVALGGALGACARYAVILLGASLAGSAFPFATLTVNVTGSLLMGALLEFSLLRSALSEPMRAFIAIGFLGSFTTFSTFSADVWSLYERGRWATVIVYLSTSVILSIAALILGMALIRRVLP